jgi:hypothetical protein
MIKPLPLEILIQAIAGGESEKETMKVASTFQAEHLNKWYCHH